MLGRVTVLCGTLGNGRRSRAIGMAGWLLTIAVLGAVGPLNDSRALGQERRGAGSGSASGASATTPAARLRDAYERSRQARTVDDLTKIIGVCEQALTEGVSEALNKYGRELLSWTHNRRGELLAEQGAEEDALADFHRSVELDGTRWKAVHNRGVSLAMLGRTQEAIADFSRTISLKPDYPNAYFNRGELRYDLGDYQAAIADYDRTIQLAPRDGAAFNSRGHAYYMLGDYRRALSDYGEAIRLDPQNAAAYTNRGDAYVDMGQFQRAANDYRAAIRIDPNLGRAYQSAAWLMATCPDEQFRNPDLAVEAANKAIELDGEDYHYLDTLAAALASAGRFDEAIDIQNRVVQTAPAEIAGPYTERLELYRSGRPFRAKAVEEAVSSGRGNSPTSRRSF